MMQGRSMRGLIFIILTFGFHLNAVSGMYDFLEGAPIASFTDEDIVLMKKNIYKALDTVVDGESLAWENKKSGHAGLANPLKTYKRDGWQCRTLRIINKSTTKIVESKFEFCKINNKLWKVISK